MMNAYDKSYLEKAQTTLVRMLDFAVYDLKLDLKDFFAADGTVRSAVSMMQEVTEKLTLNL